MPRIHDFKPSFNAGEITPRLAARLDFNKYPFALETCENLIPLSEGAAMRRSGTRFVSEEKDSTVKGRLKRFQFSVIQSYCLELGDQVLRPFRHQQPIAVAITDAAFANGSFTSNITGWDDRSTGGAGNQISHDATNGRLTLETSGTAADDIGWAEDAITISAAYVNVEHVVKFRVIAAPGDRIQFQVGSSSTGSQILAPVFKYTGYHCVAFTPTAATFYVQFRNLGSFRDKDVQIDDVSFISNANVEVDTPWLEADLYTVEGPQSADVLYLLHGDYPTHKVERYGHTTWSVVQVDWQDGPYLDENTTTTTLLPSAASGLSINLTLSSIVGVNDDQGWQSTDIGRLVRYKKSTTWGWAIITSITSSLIAVADVRKDFEATPTATTTWRIGAFWGSSTSGDPSYPQVGAFFQQRLYAAGTGQQPQSFFASQTADFENMTPDDFADKIEADDAFSYTLSADDVNAIRWLSPGEDTIAIGTAGGEWVPIDSIDATQVDVRRQTKHGSAQVIPVRIGSVVLFLQRALRKIREFGLATSVNTSYVAPDMTRLAEHVTKGGIVEMDYAEEPNSIVWAVRADGQLLSMTYKRDEDVVGWARHILGGSFSDGDAVVESVAVIPGANGSGQVNDSTERDEVWVLVKRTIDGSTVRYIEVLEKDFETGDDQEDAFYVDCGITATNVGGTELLANGDFESWPSDWKFSALPAVYFETASDFLHRDADLDGNSDTKTFTISFWFATNATGTQNYAVANSTGRFGAKFVNGKVQVFGSDTSGVACLDLISQSTYNDGQLHHCVAWGDLSTAGGTEIKGLYIDGADDLDTGAVTFIDTAIDFTAGDWAIGQNIQDQELADVWLSIASAIDCSVPANLAKFYDTVNSEYVDLGSDGSTPGVTPIIFLSVFDDDPITNKGTGGGFTEAGSVVVFPLSVVRRPTTGGNPGGAIHFVEGTLGNYADQSVTVEDGVVYEVTADSKMISHAGTATMSILVGTSRGASDLINLDITAGPTAFESFSGTFIASGTTVWVRLFRDGSVPNGGDGFLVDNVSVTKYGVVSGLDHLEGETVNVFANGAIQPSQVVSGGEIVMDVAAVPAQVGLGYAHTLKTLKVSAGNPAGTPLGKTKRIYGITFCVLNSQTFSFGRDASHLTTKDFRLVSDPMDAAAPFFTGEKFVEFEGDWTNDARILIQNSDPVPFTLLALAPETIINPLK